MIEIQARRKKRKVTPRSGETVLAACYQSGLEVDYSCQSGTCMQCMVKVADSTALAPPTRRELDRLSSERLADGYRLACQARFL